MLILALFESVGGEAEAADDGGADAGGLRDVGAEDGQDGVDVGAFGAVEAAEAGDVRAWNHRFLIVDFQHGGIVAGLSGYGEVAAHLLVHAARVDVADE